MASYALICNLGRMNVARVLSSTYPKVAVQSVILSRLNDAKRNTYQGLVMDFAPKLGSTKNFTTTPVKNMSASGDHTKLWTIERALSAGLLGIVPAAFLIPNPALEYAMALALTAHVHWGIEAIVVDYLRPKVVGDVIAKAGVIGVYVLSAVTLGGLFYFNYSDVGLTQAIKMFWKL